VEVTKWPPKPERAAAKCPRQRPPPKWPEPPPKCPRHRSVRRHRSARRHRGAPPPPKCRRHEVPAPTDEPANNSLRRAAAVAPDRVRNAPWQRERQERPRESRGGGQRVRESPQASRSEFDRGVALRSRAPRHQLPDGLAGWRRTIAQDARRGVPARPRGDGAGPPSWTPWRACSRGCGEGDRGERRRTRTVRLPRPQPICIDPRSATRFAANRARARSPALRKVAWRLDRCDPGPGDGILYAGSALAPPERYRAMRRNGTSVRVFAAAGEPFDLDRDTAITP